MNSDARKPAIAPSSLVSVPPQQVAMKRKLDELLQDVLSHSGFGEVRIAVKWLSKGRQEVILSSGKEYRFVIHAG